MTYVQDSERHSHFNSHFVCQIMMLNVYKYTVCTRKADLRFDVIEAAVRGAEVDCVDVELVVKLLFELIVVVVLLQAVTS